MMTEIAVYQSEAAHGMFSSTIRHSLINVSDNVQLPLCQAKFVNLQTSSPDGVLYPLLLSYCQLLWPGINIIDDFSLNDGAIFFTSGRTAFNMAP
jgi:hypothetical protein